MTTSYFRVAGHDFSVAAPESTDTAVLLPSYTPFQLCETPAETVFTLVLDESFDCPTEEFDEIGQFDCGGANHGVWHNDEGYLFHISDVGHTLTGVLHTSPDFRQARLRLLGNEEQQAFALNNALMIQFAFATAPRQTLLMHASVALHAERGYLFLGKSGTGKSTHTGLWLKHIENTELLNDDNPAVRIVDGRAIVFGTPWSGKTPCYRNISVPVGGITRLEQYPRNAIRRETPVVAFASVLSSCSTMIWDKPSYTAICNTVGILVGLAPCFHLRCLPDEAAARLSHATLVCPKSSACQTPS